MKKTVELLEHWKQQPVRMVKLGLVKIDDGLQPRDKKLVPFNKLASFEAASADHIDYLRAQLATSRHAQLDPVLLLQHEGKYYVVDGYHRWQAHRREQRREIPAQVLQVSWLDAVKVSKLVNTSGLKLAMHKDQRREACWQSLVMSHVEDEKLPTIRALAALFGVAKDTVEKMVKHLQTVNPKDFPTAALDPVTGWPRWKHARGQGSGWRDLMAELSEDQQRQKRVATLATRLGKVVEGVDPEDLTLALRSLGLDERLAESVARVLGMEMDGEVDSLSDSDDVPVAATQRDQVIVFPFEVSKPVEARPVEASGM